MLAHDFYYPVPDYNLVNPNDTVKIRVQATKIDGKIDYELVNLGHVNHKIVNPIWCEQDIKHIVLNEFERKEQMIEGALVEMTLMDKVLAGIGLLCIILLLVLRNV